MDEKAKSFKLETILEKKTQDCKEKFYKQFPIKTRQGCPKLTVKKEIGSKTEQKNFRKGQFCIPLKAKTYSNSFSVEGRLGCKDFSIKSQHFINSESISNTQGFLHTVFYQPRASTIQRELVIISLEGIIADYSQKQLNIRGDAVLMLKEIHLRYQLILVSGWKLSRYLKLITYLSNKGIYISAAYKQVGQGNGISEKFEKKRHDWYLDYSRVYKDFNITNESIKRVLNIIPLLGNFEELSGPHYIAQYTGALRPVFILNKAPILTSQYPIVPLSILVPHMAYFPFSMIGVIDIIKFLSSSKNFFQGAYSLNNSNFFYFSTDVIAKELFSLYQKD